MNEERECVEKIFKDYRQSPLNPSDAYRAMAQIADVMGLSWEPNLAEKLEGRDLDAAVARALRTKRQTLSKDKRAQINFLRSEGWSDQDIIHAANTNHWHGK